MKRPALTFLECPERGHFWRCVFGRISVTAPTADEALALMDWARWVGW